MIRPFSPLGFARCTAPQPRHGAHAEPLSRRGVLSAATAVALLGVDVLGPAAAEAHVADVLAFRGVEVGQYSVIRARGVVSCADEPGARLWPATETTLLSWTEDAGQVTEYRQRRLQVRIFDKILEQTHVEAERIDGEAQAYVRTTATGLRTLVLPEGLSRGSRLSEPEIAQICALPATAALPPNLSALRVIQDAGPGAAKRTHLIERTPSAGFRGVAQSSILVWRMAGTLTRWASSPVTDVRAV